MWTILAILFYWELAVINNINLVKLVKNNFFKDIKEKRKIVTSSYTPFIIFILNLLKVLYIKTIGIYIK